MMASTGNSRARETVVTKKAVFSEVFFARFMLYFRLLCGAGHLLKKHTPEIVVVSGARFNPLPQDALSL